MRRIVMLMAASLLLVASGAFAASWQQEFNESGVGNFDHMQFSMVSGSTWDDPGITFGSSSGWSQSYGDSTLLLADGSTKTSLNMWLHFGTAKSAPFSFEFAAFDGSAMADRALAEWTGSKWDFTVLTEPVDRIDAANVGGAPVPEPITMLGLLLSATGLGGYLRKRRAA